VTRIARSPASRFAIRMSFRNVATLVLGVGLILPGCGSLGGMPSKLGMTSKEAALRKKVEADPFPSANEPAASRPARTR
jgi:hypothetical protein